MAGERVRGKKSGKWGALGNILEFLEGLVRSHEVCEKRGNGIVRLGLVKA